MGLPRTNPPPFALSLSKGLGETELVEGSATPTAATIEALCAEAQQSLDLTHGPLLRALVIEVPGDGWRLLLTAHHLVIDGVSWRILLDDLRTAYGQQRTGAPILLPSKTSSTRDWVRKLQSLATDPAATQPARAHWLSTTSGSIRLWGCDRPEGAATLRQAKTLRFNLAGADTQRLLRHAPAAYRTQVNHLLLAAWARAFAKHAQGDGDGIRIDLEGHGREDLFDDIDLSRTVGWFTSVCPAVLPSAGEPGDMLRRIKATLDALPHKGLSHGALQSFGDVEVRTKLAEAPRAEVLFNYLGQFDGGQGTQQGWRLARESGGASSDADSPLSHELAINGEVIDGVLAMSFTFSTARHDEARVQALMADYRAELLALIDHCEHSAGGVCAADFPLVKLPSDALDALVARVAAKPRHIADIVPLTPGQQTMFAESLEAPGTHVNIVQMQAKVEGLDVARLQAAWREALARHPMLRTGFFAVDGRESMQVTLRHVDTAIEWLDWRDRPLAKGLADWQALCEAERVRGFDLERPPLARWHVARLADGASRIAWTWHHLLLDGWSMSQLLGEVFTAYAGQPLKPAGPPFAAFVQALQRSTPQRDTDDQAFWRSRWALAGAPTRLCTKALSVWAPQGLASAAVTLDAAAIAPLRRFAHAEQITLNTLVQAAWGLVLMSHLGRDGVCFGTTVSGRSVEMDDVDGVMGLCINQLPLMLRREPTQAVGDWLRSLLDANLALRQHEHTALGRIQQWIGVHEPLYDTLVVFENYPIDAAVTGGPGDALGLTEVVSHGALGTPMSLIAMPSPDGALTLSLEHARSVFEPEMVAGLLQRLTRLLDELARDAARPIGDIAI
jgi:non-ribosomal peptide synthase protein (TIGR01720 family)